MTFVIPIPPKSLILTEGLYFLCRLKDLLIDQMTIAKTDLIEAADRGPMYSVLVCIRLVCFLNY